MSNQASRERLSHSNFFVKMVKLLISKKEKYLYRLPATCKTRLRSPKATAGIVKMCQWGNLQAPSLQGSREDLPVPQSEVSFSTVTMYVLCAYKCIQHL